MYMKARRFVWLFVSIVLAASLALAACAPKQAAETPAAGEKLAVGIVLPTKDEPRWIQD